jgi:DNA repair protein RadA/Sms
MKKLKSQFVCQSCGAIASKWGGKCEACSAWNSLVEEIISSTSPMKTNADVSHFFSDLKSDDSSDYERIQTNINEFDRVCGGGLVPGSVILVGGDPGIGKSTLLLQVVAKLAQQGHMCAYVSGEEALSQLRMRANRLMVDNAPVSLAAHSTVNMIIPALCAQKGLKVAIIDSIQTMRLEEIESAAGSVSQVRACAEQLIRAAKEQGFVVILVGHVTKEGNLAGPRVLEHMVDTVLYFEGERTHDYRLLRTVKNRFGATDEIGVFSMGSKGLEEISNPSNLFLSDPADPVSGVCVYAGIEGTRPLLVEIQALVSPTHYPAPRRTTVGWDLNRLAMLLAVLETRCNMNFSNKDVYVNVSGGLKINDPAADLAVAAAIISSLKNVPLPQQSVYFGEVALTGIIRGAAHSTSRIKEAYKLGFKNIISGGKTKTDEKGVKLSLMNGVRDLQLQ